MSALPPTFTIDPVDPSILILDTSLSQGMSGPIGNLTDGNKGDITVSSGGTNWTVNSGLVYYFPSLLDVVGVNAGDLVIIENDKAYRATGPASFVALVADPTSHSHVYTKSQLNTAVTDGDILFVGDVSGSAVTIRDIDGTPTIAATIIEFTNGTVSDQGSGVARITGLTGATGATGPQGNPGTNGTNGTNGTQGNPGIQGLQGIQGITGPQGATGDQGLTGPAGVSGANGLDGPNTLTTSTTTTFTGPIIGNGATVEQGAFGSTSGTFCQGNDSRIVNAALTFKIDTAATGEKKLFFRVPYSCTITGWELVADVSGSVVIDIWKDTYANYPPTNADSITASAKPTLSSVIKNTSSTLTGWTTALTVGDYIEIEVESVTTITNVTLTLTVTRP